MQSFSSPPPGAADLAALRQTIRQLEGYKHAAGGTGLNFGLPALDAALPDGRLAAGATHECLIRSREDLGATAGLITALMARANRALPVVWIARRHSLYAPGLLTHGFDPMRLIMVETRKDQDALWAMEEALRCPGLAAVIGEIGDADLTATRRLQLAVEKGGATGFVLRVNAKYDGLSACVTRWHISPAPSVPADGLPGLGAARWAVDLLKARAGTPGQWMIEWNGHEFTQPQSTRPARRPVSRISAA